MGVHKNAMPKLPLINNPHYINCGRARAGRIVVLSCTIPKRGWHMYGGDTPPKIALEAAAHHPSTLTHGVIPQKWCDVILLIRHTVGPGKIYSCTQLQHILPSYHTQEKDIQDVGGPRPSVSCGT